MGICGIIGHWMRSQLTHWMERQHLSPPSSVMRSFPLFALYLLMARVSVQSCRLRIYAGKKVRTRTKGSSGGTLMDTAPAGLFEAIAALLPMTVATWHKRDLWSRRSSPAASASCSGPVVHRRAEPCHVVPTT